MQIVENWTCVTGEVLAVTPPAASDKRQIDLTVVRTAPVKGFADLVKIKAGERISIRLPAGFTLADAEVTGRTVTIPVRMARGNLYFTHPDWSPDKGSSLCR